MRSVVARGQAYVVQPVSSGRHSQIDEGDTSALEVLAIAVSNITRNRKYLRGEKHRIICD
jgi:hypothetical protein